MQRLFLLVLASVLLLSTAACTDDAPEVARTPEAILSASADAMRDVQTVTFSIAKDGAPVFLDADRLFEFRGATARYASPAAADALVQIRTFGVNTEVGAVAKDGRLFFTNPLTERWEQAPESITFDPTVLFDPETGWNSLLRDGIAEPQLIDSGGGRHHVRGTVDGERIEQLTGGLATTASEVDLFIDDGSYLVDEVRFDVEAESGTSEWTVRFEEYGSDVTVTIPEL